MKFQLTSRSLSSKLKYFIWILLFFLISLLTGIFVYSGGFAGLGK